MPETTRCPQCGKPLPPDAPAGLCPECLLKQGRESPSASEIGSSELPPTTPAVGGKFAAPSPEELSPLFPNLEILELLGKGGMGAVYKARQPHLDRFVALKVLPPEVGNDPAFQERFTREARALARLNHPHIVAVYDFGEAGPHPGPLPGGEGEQADRAGASPHPGPLPEGEGGKRLYYFIMEYVDGANVRQLIQQGGLKPEEALAMVPQICEALQYAHDEGIVHRDIKPENILIDKKGRVKIADFGLAKLVRPSPLPLSQGERGGEGGVRGFTLTASGQVMGTPHYMAPEQMKGSHEVDHRADIYSLGVVFYEMLTGELPIGKFEPPSKKEQIDVRLDEVVLRALENEPDRRYQKASDVKTDVEAICGGVRSAVVRPPTAPESEPRDAESSYHLPPELTEGAVEALVLMFAVTPLALMIRAGVDSLYLLFDPTASPPVLQFGDTRIGSGWSRWVWISLGPVLAAVGIALVSYIIFRAWKTSRLIAVLVGLWASSVFFGEKLNDSRSKGESAVDAAATAREIAPTEEERRSPGLSVFRYELELPRGCGAQFSTELWRHGKLERSGIDVGQLLYTGRGQIELRLQKREMLSQQEVGKLRWDWRVDKQEFTGFSGGWIDDPFAGAKRQMSTWRAGTERWELVPDKEHTLLILRGWEQSSAMGDVPESYARNPTAFAEAIQRGEIPRADVELYLKVRIRRE